MRYPFDTSYRSPFCLQGFAVKNISFAACACFVLLTGCAVTGVDAVRQTAVTDDLSWGKVIGNYRDADNVRWSQIESEDGKTLVTVTYSFKSVKEAREALSAIALKSFVDKKSALIKNCNDRVKEAEIDFSSGMAVREMDEAARDQALQEVVAAMLKNGVWDSMPEVESKDDVIILLGKDAKRKSQFEAQYAKAQKQALQAAAAKRNAQKEELKQQVRQACLAEIAQKQTLAQAWSNVSSVEQTLVLQKTDRVRALQATMKFVWPDGTSLVKDVCPQAWAHLPMTQTTLAQFLQAHNIVGQELVGGK